MSRAQLEEAKKLHQENVERAQAAARRQRDKDQADYQARMRREKEERDRKQFQRDAQRRASHADEANSPRKRPIESTQTTAQSRTMPSGGKRAKLDGQQKLLVWKDGLGFDDQARETLVERALREGCPDPKQTDEAMIRDSIRDGLAIRADSDGICFHTDGLDPDPWTKCTKWKELVSGLEVVEGKDLRTRVVADGGKSCMKIGQGTFNIVLSYPPMYVASYLPGNLAWRVTRPDKDEGGEYRYQNMSTTVGELKNAIFASSNRIGVPVYGVAAFEAIRPGRTMRHGIVMAMERADCDLIRSLDCMRTEAEGSEAADKIIELLYRVSRMGIAFTDIKPGNILTFKDNDGAVFYRLTDYDPAFFMMTDKDWRSLLLLNLSFLSAHIHNFDFGAAGRGWAKAVAPVLRQLVSHRNMYDGKWLFAARSVSVDFREPRSTSDFELQRNITSMWYSYFVKRASGVCRSKKFKWYNMETNQRELNKHWDDPTKRTSWPEHWATALDKQIRADSKNEVEYSVVKQMVDFALEYS
jgi:hypothetical protein